MSEQQRSTYLRLDYKKGELYEYSPTPGDDFEKHVSTTGKESWRRYYPEGVNGKLASVSVRNTDFGDQLSIGLEGKVYISVNVANQKGNVDQFAESIIRQLPPLSLGDNVRIRPYNFVPEDSKYARVGFSIAVDGEKVDKLSVSYYKDGELVQGDIPAIEWKTNPLGKNRPSAASLERKDEYLLEVLSQACERLKFVPNSTVPTSSTKEVKEDDMPF